VGGFPASALASRTEATFCFRMRMQMQAMTGLALRTAMFTMDMHMRSRDKLLGSHCNCGIVLQPASEYMGDSEIGETAASSVCVCINIYMIYFIMPYVVVFTTHHSIKGLDRWRHCLESGRRSVHVLRTKGRCLLMKPLFFIQQDK
jgi:hypothetical protein